MSSEGTKCAYSYSVESRLGQELPNLSPVNECFASIDWGECINVGDAAECPACILTKREVYALAKYWTRIVLEITVCRYQCNCVECSSLKNRDYARQQLRRLTDAIGIELANDIYDEVAEEFREELVHEVGKLFETLESRPHVYVV